MKILVPLLLSMAFVGCASTGDQSASFAASGEPVAMTADEAYVSYVETIANRRGTRVVWVNAPTKDLHSDSVGRDD